jgi:hypothetical protein
MGFVRLLVTVKSRVMPQPFVEPDALSSSVAVPPMVIVGCTSAQPDCWAMRIAPVFRPGRMLPAGCVHDPSNGAMLLLVVLNQRASSDTNCTMAVLTVSSCGQPCGNEMRAYRQTSHAVRAGRVELPGIALVVRTQSAQQCGELLIRIGHRAVVRERHIDYAG